MSSGNDRNPPGLDRIIKLWISLWNLVLENKRHYETVCAVLQRLVYEKTAWPKFKNWPVICQLGKTEPLMQQIIQELDISQTNERNARIIAAFGDCFSQTMVSGIPLTVIHDFIVERLIKDETFTDIQEAREYVIASGSYTIGTSDDDINQHFGFPIIFLSTTTDLESVDLDFMDDTPLFSVPDYIDPEQIELWKPLMFNNRSYVVIEKDDTNHSHNYGYIRFALVPAEYIALDL